MKLNAQEDAEMEVFVMKDTSVSVLMDSTDLTVRKVKNREPDALACFLINGAAPVFLIHPLKLFFWLHYKNWQNLIKPQKSHWKVFLLGVFFCWIQYVVTGAENFGTMYTYFVTTPP